MNIEFEDFVNGQPVTVSTREWIEDVNDGFYPERFEVKITHEIGAYLTEVDRLRLMNKARELHDAAKFRLLDLPNMDNG